MPMPLHQLHNLLARICINWQNHPALFCGYRPMLQQDIQHLQMPAKPGIKLLVYSCGHILHGREAGIQRLLRRCSLP